MTDAKERKTQELVKRREKRVTKQQVRAGGSSTEANESTRLACASILAARVYFYCQESTVCNLMLQVPLP